MVAKGILGLLAGFLTGHPILKYLLYNLGKVEDQICLCQSYWTSTHSNKHIFDNFTNDVFFREFEFSHRYSAIKLIKMHMKNLAKWTRTVPTTIKDSIVSSHARANNEKGFVPSYENVSCGNFLLYNLFYRQFFRLGRPPQYVFPLKFRVQKNLVQRKRAIREGSLHEKGNDEGRVEN